MFLTVPKMTVFSFFQIFSDMTDVPHQFPRVCTPCLLISSSAVIAVNTGVWMFFAILFPLPSDTHREVGWPGDMVVLLFRFWGARTLFSIVLRVHRDSLFSTRLPALVNCRLLGDCCSTGVKRFAFPWWLVTLTIFSWTCWPWNRHFGKLSTQFLCHFSFWPHLLACGILVPPSRNWTHALGSENVACSSLGCRDRIPHCSF